MKTVGTVLIRYTNGEHFEFLGYGEARSMETGKVITLTGDNCISKFQITRRRIVRIAS